MGSIKTLLLIASALLSGLVGASALAAPQDRMTLFQQAADATSARDVYVNGIAKTCRPGAVGISQWFANKYSSDGQNVPISWNASAFTGFDPGDPSTHQLGLTDSQYGGTVIQFNGPTNGWQIETTTARPGTNDAGFIAGICSAATICDGKGGELKVRPFERPDRLLVYGIDLQVPYSNASGETVNTASLMIYFTDPTVPPAGLGFWYSFAAYSSVDQSETVIYDAGTESAVVGTFTGYSGRYATDIGGQGLQRSTWLGMRRFNAAMTAQNLRNAIAGIKAAAAKNGTFSKYAQLSDDPSIYIIGGGILDTEVARVNNFDGGMGLSSQNMNISLLTGGAGCSHDGRQLAWSCGAGRPGPEWNPSGGECYQYASPQACH